MPGPFLTVDNVHAASCGEPPVLHVTIREARYVGYFMNLHGEQWLFIGRPDGTAVVSGGDALWTTEYPVVEGVAYGLVTNVDEALWVRACWFAWRGRERS